MDKSITRDRSSGPQSATVHVTLSPVDVRVTLITVPLGAVRWAHVRSGALYHDASPRSVWAYFAAGLTCVNAGKTTSTRVVVVVVGGTVVVVLATAATVVDVVVGFAAERATVVDVARRVDVVTPDTTCVVDVVDVVDGGTTAAAGGSLTIRPGLTHVDVVDTDAAAPAVTSYVGASAPGPMLRRTNAGSNNTEAHTPAA